METTTIYRASLHGGLVGILATNPRKSVSKAVSEASNRGEELVCIIPDHTNLGREVIYLAILFFTFFLWCPALGYLIVTNRKLPAPANK